MHPQRFLFVHGIFRDILIPFKELEEAARMDGKSMGYFHPNRASLSKPALAVTGLFSLATFGIFHFSSNVFE